MVELGGLAMKFKVDNSGMRSKSLQQTTDLNSEIGGLALYRKGWR